MPTFPTLTITPTIRGWKESKAVDPTLRVQTEAGYAQTRAKFTRITKKWGAIQYSGMFDSDKALISAFEETVKVGSDSFTWTNSEDNASYTVRFLAPIEYELTYKNGNEKQWSVSFQLEEV